MGTVHRFEERQVSDSGNLVPAPTATAVLHHVVRSIVDDPDAVSVDHREGDDQG